LAQQVSLEGISLTDVHVAYPNQTRKTQEIEALRLAST
jgi:hypothetical protein